jgi:hypothetical protein
MSSSGVHDFFKHSSLHSPSESIECQPSSASSPTPGSTADRHVQGVHWYSQNVLVFPQTNAQGKPRSFPARKSLDCGPRPSVQS